MSRSTGAAVAVRRMRLDDLPSVAAIQATAYPPHFLEDEATLQARLNDFPDTAWVAQGPSGVCAYLVAYRSVLGKVTPLGAHFESPLGADCLYLHDLAVSATAAGQGLGPLLVQHALAMARREGLAASALVSVQGSQGFWRRMAYQAQRLDDPQQQAHLASYPGTGVYMMQVFAIK
jgi:ribosomal protein S18 acetylase RimI-like enzyme